MRGRSWHSDRMRPSPRSTRGGPLPPRCLALALGVSRGIHVTVPRGRAADLKAMAVDLRMGVEAPVSAGQELGRVSVTLDDKEIISEPLVALKPVEAGGFFTRFWDSLVLFFLQLFGKA